MKGEEWKDAHFDCWQLCDELEIERSFVGMLVKKKPVEKVAKALRAARGKREPKSYVIAVLDRRTG